MGSIAQGFDPAAVSRLALLKGIAVLKVHTSDGRTVKVDLQDEGQAREWLRRFADPAFQGTVTGLTVSHLGVQYSIPRPTGFDPVSFMAELVESDPDRKVKGGERISCFAGDVRATIMIHREQKAARLSLFRLGKQRYNPGYNPLKAKGAER